MENSIFLIVFILITTLTTSLLVKVREYLNQFSKKVVEQMPTLKKNNVEIVMQPKWFLFSSIFIYLPWIFTCYLLFPHYNYWAILYTIILYFGSAFLSKIIPFPSRNQSLVFFKSTTQKRINNASMYNRNENILLISTNAILKDECDELNLKY
jgi:hypothetical protein